MPLTNWRNQPLFYLTGEWSSVKNAYESIGPFTARDLKQRCQDKTLTEQSIVSDPFRKEDQEHWRKLRDLPALHSFCFDEVRILGVPTACVLHRGKHA